MGNADLSKPPQGKVNTSTPTLEARTGGASRRSTLERMDMSSINASHINETAASTSSVSFLPPAAAEADALARLAALDVTCQQRSQCLKGCKIYLCGLTNTEITKAKKLIVCGSGCRLNALNDNVTHVIMGRPSDEDVKALKEMDSRCVVVTIQWLIDSVEGGSLKSPAQYFVPDCSLNATTEETSTINVSMTDLSSARENYNTTHTTASSRQDVQSGNQIDANNTTAVMRDMSTQDPRDTTHAPDMQSILGQYVAPGERSDADQTQDQDQYFQGQTFAVIGFDNEPTQCLEDYVVAGGGIVCRSNRQIPDYAVVPIFGQTVNVRATKFVTNTWLQTCVEECELLHETANPLFSPIIPQQEHAKPLTGCVISVSGYAGSKRDTLLYIAELLGARCQDYFVRRDIIEKDLLANTHLVACAAEGAKYEAATKWGVHIVTATWMIECARASVKLSESNFSLDNELQTETNNSTVFTEKTPRVSLHSSATSGAQAVKPGLGTHTRSVTSGSTTSADTSDEQNTSSKNSRKPSGSCNTPAMTGSASVSSATMPLNHHVRDVENQPQRQNTVSRGLFSSSDALQAATTVTPANNRVSQLRGQSTGSRTPVTPSQDGWETPSKFCAEGVEFIPKFDLDDVYKCIDNMKTPTGVQNKRQSGSFSDEYIGQQLQIALKQVTEKKASTPVTPLSQRPRFHTEDSPAVFQSVVKKPLVGLVMYVAKKLTKKQAEYNSMCAALGADYRWTYDQTCTHVIFQGKKNDTNKEYRLAKDQKKFIVSPSWLFACQQENRRVEESAYPHTHNPQMSLTVESQVFPSSRPATRTAAQQQLDNSGKENELTAVDSSRQTGQNLKKPVEATEANQPNLETTGDYKKTPDNFGESLHQLMQQEKSVSPVPAGRVTRSHMRASRSSDNENVSKTSSSSGETTDTKRLQAYPRLARKLDTEPSQQYDVVWADHVNNRMDIDYGRLGGAHMNTSTISSATKPTDTTGLSSVTHDAGDLTADRETSKDTTEARPPVAFPWPELPEVAAAATDSMQDLLDSEMNEEPSQPPSFLLSGLQPQEKDDYIDLIDELGGQVLDCINYDPRCTHLVLEMPTRNEKFLACVAAGKWVLHKSYFEACRASRCFVSEADYEWGSPSTLPLLADRPSVVKFAQAVVRWRKYSEEKHRSGQLGGAFRGWRVLLLIDKKKEESFGRVLMAGGADVRAMDKVQDDLTSINYCFVDSRAIDSQKDFVKMVQAAGVSCCKTEYISDYLNEDPTPGPDQHKVQLTSASHKRSEIMNSTSQPKKKRTK